MLFTQRDQPTRSILGLNDDILYLICLTTDREKFTPLGTSLQCQRRWSSLTSFCSTCKRTREIGAPLLFRKGTLTDCKTDRIRLPSIDPWLTCMERSDYYQRHMKVLHVELFSILDHEALRLANILRRTTNLKGLKLITPQSRDTTQDRLLPVLKSIELPRLEILLLSVGLEELIPQFGSITSLRIKGEQPERYVSTEILQRYLTAEQLPHLQHLELCQDADWSPIFLVALNTNFPQLQSLGVLKGGKPGYSFEALLRIPDLFLQLRKLYIAPLNQLGLRYFNPPLVQCHDARKPCKPPVWFCKRHIPDGLRYAAIVAFNAFPNLQMLQFVKQARVTCVLGDNGSVADTVVEHEAEEARE